MLEKIFHLLSGYIEFKVVGDGGRLFTMVAKRGIGLWGYRRAGGVPTARIKAREYRRLRPLCRRSGCRVQMVEKRGVPFWLRPLGRRKGLVVGAALGAALFVFLSGFLWGVSVTGAQDIPDSLILRAAGEYGLYVGSPLSSVDPRRASHGILGRLPQLSWAGVSTDGCFMEIAVKEGQPQPEPESGEGLSNIVALREGQVVEIEAEKGRPEVALGETVQKGQLLISGLYQERQDPWAEPLEDPLQVQGPARGRVVALTYREFTVQVGAEKKDWVETGTVKTASALHLFGVRIPLYLYEPQGQGRRYTESLPLKALGTALPVSLERQVLVEWEQQVRPLSQAQQQQQALLKLRQAQRAQLPPGGCVVEESLSFSFGEGVCILQAKCRCREEIGLVQEILVE